MIADTSPSIEGMYMSPTVNKDVIEFQQGLQELYELTDNFFLSEVLEEKEVRKVEDVRRALANLTNPKFSLEDVVNLTAVIKRGGGEEEIPDSINLTCTVAQKATRLLDLYATILKVPRNSNTKLPSWARARVVDRITVVTQP